MTKITKEVHIDAGVTEVWAALADFGNIYKCGPNIVKSHLTSEQTQGLGTTRHCDISMMNASLEERITGWEPEKSLSIEIYSSEKMPGVIGMHAKFELQAESQGTRLKAYIAYRMKWGLLGSMMNTLMLKPMSNKNWTRFIAGIKHHIETGETVGSPTKLNLATVS